MKIFSNQIPSPFLKAFAIICCRVWWAKILTRRPLWILPVGCEKIVGAYALVDCVYSYKWYKKTNELTLEYHQDFKHVLEINSISGNDCKNSIHSWHVAILFPHFLGLSSQYIK